MTLRIRLSEPRTKRCGCGCETTLAVAGVFVYSWRPDLEFSSRECATRWLETQQGTEVTR